MIILNISEEYGCNQWYAILSNERYEELKKNWQTIKGLNCLVPVRFLIPEAVNFPLRIEDQKFADPEFLRENNVRIENAHIHQSDDSYIADLNYEIPEQENFEFMGIEYTSEQISEIFNKYRTEDDQEYDKRYEANPEFFEHGIAVPEAWGLLDGFGPLDEIYDWPEDMALPKGWIRHSDGRIVRSS